MTCESAFRVACEINMKCGSVECEVWMCGCVECEVWSGGVQSVECGVWSVKCGV